MRESEGRLTPDVLAGFSIAQAHILGQSANPADVMRQAVDLANQTRARRGLPPLPGK